MKRYYINIKHGGFVTINKIMLDSRGLNDAKKHTVRTMSEYGSINATIMDEKYNEVSEFKHGKWIDKNIITIKCRYCGKTLKFDLNTFKVGKVFACCGTDSGLYNGIIYKVKCPHCGVINTHKEVEVIG